MNPLAFATVVSLILAVTLAVARNVSILAILRWRDTDAGFWAPFVLGLPTLFVLAAGVYWRSALLANVAGWIMLAYIWWCAA